MNIAEKDAFAEAVALLSAGGDLRVWSIIVTIFGDLAQEEGDSIGGAVISAITGAMGIKPAAMRVALHRLRKDGWIESMRDGRVSRYCLSAYGRAESAAASGRIYGEAERPRQWKVVALPQLAQAARSSVDRALAESGYEGIAPGVFIGTGQLPSLPHEPFVFEGAWRSVPDWLKQAAASPELAEAYRLLADQLQGTRDLVLRAPPDSPLGVVTLRTLIVHQWRRIVLRHPALPDAFRPEGWPGTQCRELVAELLQRLPRPSLDALETHVAEMP